MSRLNRRSESNTGNIFAGTLTGRDRKNLRVPEIEGLQGDVEHEPGRLILKTLEVPDGVICVIY